MKGHNTTGWANMFTTGTKNKKAVAASVTPRAMNFALRSMSFRIDAE